MYPLLRSLDPHHARAGYLGALATVATRSIDTPAALAARFRDLLFERIYPGDPRLVDLMDRVGDARREQLHDLQRQRPADEDPAAILAGPSASTGWYYLGELWLHDACMPSALGLLARDQVDRTIDLARWTRILLPTMELSEIGFVLQRLLEEARTASRSAATVNLINVQARPALPLLYLRQLLLGEMLFPFLVGELVERQASGRPLRTRGTEGVLLSSVNRMMTVIGEPTNPDDIYELNDVFAFRRAIERSPSTQENYLRPRMEILVDIGLVGRRSGGHPPSSQFAWIVTESTRRLASEWTRLERIPNPVPEYLDAHFFTSMARVLARPLRSAGGDDERLLWFARAFQLIGREFGFTPGRVLALLACLLAWEAGTALEVSEVVGAVHGATRSVRARHLHFSGGSRFDQEFLIRLDDALLDELEHAAAGHRATEP